jgi:hypothetical protein
MTRFLVYAGIMLAGMGEPLCTFDCTGTAFELRINGIPVVTDRDMTEDECNSAAEDIDPQTPPFTEIQCVEVSVARENS